MIDVAMPWRPSPDRLPAFERVTQFWERNGFNVVTADSDRRRKAFSITQARNAAVRECRGESGVVVVADADTIPDLGAVMQAVEVVKLGELIRPFTSYRHIPMDAVTQSDLHSVTPDKTYGASLGGLFIIHRDTYFEWGGMDERFEPRWGYEDNAFEAVASTLGVSRRLPGTVYSFNHSADRDMSWDNLNRWRNELYRTATGSPELMRELIKR